MSLTYAIENLKQEMLAAGIEQEHGLGTELFHFSSTLAPVSNVDLLITDDDDRVLLSWRNDGQTGSGWHVPGSCIRFQETLEEAIQRCSRSELGTEVEHSIEPIKVYEFHWKSYRTDVSDQRERAHFITLSYACRLPVDYELEAVSIRIENVVIIMETWNFGISLKFRLLLAFRRYEDSFLEPVFIRCKPCYNIMYYE